MEISTTNNIVQSIHHKIKENEIADNPDTAKLEI